MQIKKTALSVLTCCLLFGCAEQAAIQAAKPIAITQAANELQFNEFYKNPVGPYGLEPTSKLLSLNGKRVHIQGHMTQEEQPTPGIFILAALPVNIPEKEDGPSDDLPGATVFVHMPADDANKTLAYRTGLWDLQGILQLGPKEEANGRVSYVRLLLDQSATQELSTSENKSAQEVSTH